jgi:hypothetical protein
VFINKVFQGCIKNYTGMAFEAIDFINPVGKFLLLTIEALFLNHINI